MNRDEGNYHLSNIWDLVTTPDARGRGGHPTSANATVTTVPSSGDSFEKDG